MRGRCLRPFDNPSCGMIEAARREQEQVIDHINLDQVTFSGYSAQAEGAGAKGHPELCRLHCPA
jgi:hypothetical protein